MDQGEVSEAVDELRAFIADNERLPLHPGSRRAREVETARRAVEAYDAARVPGVKESADVLLARGGRPSTRGRNA